MVEIINKSCGLDIHKRFFIAIILNKSGEKQQRRFNRNDDGILALKKWVVSEECNVIACESTSDFWVPIYDSLTKHIPVLVGNARDMKAFTHKKTDKVDPNSLPNLHKTVWLRHQEFFQRITENSIHMFDFVTNLYKKELINNEAHSILTPECLT